MEKTEKPAAPGEGRASEELAVSNGGSTSNLRRPRQRTGHASRAIHNKIYRRALSPSRAQCACSPFLTTTGALRK